MARLNAQGTSNLFSCLIRFLQQLVRRRVWKKEDSNNDWLDLLSHVHSNRRHT